MNIVVTGTPGTGKTTFSKALAKKISYSVINEKDFALKNGIGKFSENDELEIPLNLFEKKANSFLLKNNNTIFEGHLLCELKLKVDKVILLTLDPEKLEMRLNLRNYSPEKIMDNVFCEGIEYCKKHARRNYNNLIEIESREITKMLSQALKELG